MAMLTGMRRAARRAPCARFLRRFLGNLLAGCRFACGFPRPRFHVSPGQLLGLLALGWLFALAADWLYVDGPVRLSAAGVATEAARAYWWLVLIAVLAALHGRLETVLRLAVVCAAAEPVLWLGWFAAIPIVSAPSSGPESQAEAVVWWGLFAWQIGILARALWREPGRARWRVPALAALYAAGLYASIQHLPDDPLLVAREPVVEAPPLDVEGLYHAQSDLIAESLSSLAPGRPGVPDFFFLGFGAYADEAVFRREVSQVRDIVARRFDAASRSVMLVNSRRTMHRHALASRSNLDYVLYQLGRRMEPEQDILFLFMTSHGRETGNLVVDFGALGLNDLEPSHLREMLDKAGIRWRVLVVSACYSGAFVPALADERTLVITAAAHDRSSFGCAHENQWTYFGEAYFRDALAGGRSLTEAFEIARSAIAARESLEGKDASLPQMAVGSAIEAHLVRWEAGR